MGTEIIAMLIGFLIGNLIGLIELKTVRKNMKKDYVGYLYITDDPSQPLITQLEYPVEEIAKRKHVRLFVDHVYISHKKQAP